ncbi:MAG: hypothetical protein ABEL51_06085 [Salinibacter sp.]
MYRRRHLVWLEVFGIVVLLALLLAPLAYLATEMTGGGGGSGIVAGNAPGGPTPAATQGRLRSSGSPTPVAGLSSPGFSSGGRLGEGASAPFSKGWREQATPDLTGASEPAAQGGVRAGGLGTAGGVGAGAVASGETFSRGASSGAGARETGLTGRFGGGPALAGRMPLGGHGSAAGKRTSNRDWQAEAQETVQKGRKLAGQIERMTGASTSGGTAAKQSASDPGSPDNPDRRNPDSPSDVPIGDHLHWLAMVGILWGAWRIGRGGVGPEAASHKRGDTAVENYGD